MKVRNLFFYGAVTETHPQALAEPFYRKEALQVIYETVTFDSLEGTQDYPPKLFRRTYHRKSINRRRVDRTLSPSDTN
ncbi:hypothetical protein JG559_10670 [Enterococcus faecalis]|uniref:Uncharacterized protein n=1 Tax=Enterococcus faecalis TaxID=1351 RepID=A0A974S6E1_ENTFL|nr:hypothetical protein JG559_10670 [Enterococcus faecalis]